MSPTTDPIALPWGGPLSDQFITNVGLITSDGPIGPNVMAAEWTHLVAHHPGLIAISIGASKATAVNVRATGEFGVNLVSREQAAFAHVAGCCSGAEFDKLGALTALGLELYPGKRIGPAMIVGAALNAECRLHREVPLGAGYVLLIGEVLEAAADGAPPLAYHQRSFWQLQAAECARKELPDLREILERNRRGAQTPPARTDEA